MSKVSITRSLLDDLAMSISAKSGEAVPLTLTEMKDAVDDIQVGSTTIESLSITENGTYTAQSGHAYSPVTVAVPTPTPSLQTKTYTVSSAGTATVTADSGYDGLSSVQVSVPNGQLVRTLTTSVTPSVEVNEDGVVVVSAEETSTVHPIYASGWVDEDETQGVYATAYVEYQLPTQAATTITPSTSTQTAVAAGKYTTGAITVAAMPTGTAGTPTATKGTVSNHQVSVTPSVTNTAGYISGGTKTGTAVTVSASELVSGTYTVDSSGTKDVTNYASASVPAGTAGTPTASKGTVSNHAISVTPSVTNTTGFITGSTKTGTAVSVSASELVSGTLSLTDNGTSDVTNYASVNVNIPFVTYYTGSTNPASSLGSNGDIYLKVVS